MHNMLFSSNAPKIIDFRKEILETIFVYIYEEIYRLASVYAEHIELNLPVDIAEYFKYLSSDDFIHQKLLPIFLKHFVRAGTDESTNNLRASVFVDITEAFNYMIKNIIKSLGNNIFTIPSLVQQQAEIIISLTLRNLEDNAIFPRGITFEDWKKSDPNIIFTTTDHRKCMKGDFQAEYASIFYKDFFDLMHKTFCLLCEIYVNKIFYHQNKLFFDEDDLELISLFLGDAKHASTNKKTTELEAIQFNLKKTIIPSFQQLTQRIDFNLHIKNKDEKQARRMISIAAYDLANHVAFRKFHSTRPRRVSLE